jgi:uncharacterized membrane protein YhaH (DUF805 family)
MLLKNLGILIFLPILLSLGPPIALVFASLREFRYSGGACMCAAILLLGPILFALGCIISAIAVALFLVPGMIYQTIRMFKLVLSSC